MKKHRQHYGQFVTPEIKDLVLRRFGITALLASRDEHLNDIPLHQWDTVALSQRSLLSIPAELAGNYGPEWNGKRMYSLANGVCVLKEAARQCIEDRGHKVGAEQVEVSP